MSSAFRRGQLYWAEVPYLPERPLDILRRGRRKGELRVVLTFKRRPVLIVQNDRDNANPRYRYLLSVVFLNQLRTLNKNLVTDYIGELSVVRMPELNVKLALSLGLVAP